MIENADRPLPCAAPCGSAARKNRGCGAARLPDVPSSRWSSNVRKYLPVCVAMSGAEPRAGSRPAEPQAPVREQRPRGGNSRRRLREKATTSSWPRGTPANPWAHTCHARGGRRARPLRKHCVPGPRPQGTAPVRSDARPGRRARCLPARRAHRRRPSARGILTARIVRLRPS